MKLITKELIRECAEQHIGYGRFIYQNQIYLYWDVVFTGEDENVKMKKNIDDLHKQLQRMEIENSMLRDENENLKKEIENGREELQNKHTEDFAREDEMKSLKMDIEENVEEKIDNLRKEIYENLKKN